MIIVKMISGLGNQLFQYAIGRHLSILRGVPLKVDLSFFDNQQLRSYKLHHYRTRAGIATEAEVEEQTRRYTSPSLSARLYRKISPLFPKYRTGYYKEAQWWVYEPEVFRVPTDVYLEGYWQHYKYFDRLHPIVLEELVVNEPYPAAAQGMLAEIQENPASVSIHVRRGDYVSDPEACQLFGVLPLAYYHHAIEHMRAKVKEPNFYVFSDDLDWVRDNLQVQASLTLVEIADGSQDYLELDLMSKCRHNIIANSSFSWWGAFLNKNPAKTVVAPGQWCVPPEINKRVELQLPDWIKV